MLVCAQADSEKCIIIKVRKENANRYLSGLYIS